MKKEIILRFLIFTIKKKKDFFKGFSSCKNIWLERT